VRPAQARPFLCLRQVNGKASTGIPFHLVMPLNEPVRIDRRPQAGLDKRHASIPTINNCGVARVLFWAAETLGPCQHGLRGQ